MIDSRVIEGTVIGDRSFFRLDESADPVTEIGLHLDLTGGKIPLEVFLVVVRVPQAPLHIRKYLNMFRRIRPVGEFCQKQLAGILHGYEMKLVHLQTLFRRNKPCIAHAVMAFIAVKICPRGLPAGIPDRIVIFYENVFAVAVSGHIIVAISCNAQKTCIFIEGIAAASIGNQ